MEYFLTTDGTDLHRCLSIFFVIMEKNEIIQTFQPIVRVLFVFRCRAPQLIF